MSAIRLFQASALLAATTFFPRAGAQPMNLNRTEPVKGAPYSAEAVTEFPLANGGTLFRTVSRVYRDSEGRERREEGLDPSTGLSPDPNRMPTVTIFDPVEGASYTLNVLKHTAVRVPLPGAPRGTSVGTGGGPSLQPTIVFEPTPGPAGAGAQIPQVRIEQGDHVEVTGNGLSSGPAGPPPISSGPRVEHLEPKTIEGLRAEGTRIVEPLPGNSGETVTESWTSPDLKVALINQMTSPRGGSYTYRLNKISRAEPDAELFQVPSDYTIQEAPGIFGGMVSEGVTVGVQPHQ